MSDLLHISGQERNTGKISLRDHTGKPGKRSENLQLQRFGVVRKPLGRFVYQKMDEVGRATAKILAFLLRKLTPHSSSCKKRGILTFSL
jgi:hypothetical protein